jgi:hypothetical protein
MTDLNHLLPAGHDDVLTTANDIDDIGRITGQAIDGGGAPVAFLAAPVCPFSRGTQITSDCGSSEG